MISQVYAKHGWEKGGGKYVKNRLPKSHIWHNKEATKEKEKGRAKGAMLIGKNKEWGDEEWEVIETDADDIIHVRIKEKKGVFNIIMVYNSVYKKEVGDTIKKEIEEYENENCIRGRYFNIRVGEIGREKTEWDIRRKSKDKTIGNGGKRFMEIMQERG